VLNHTVLFGRANEQTVPPDSRATGHRKGTRHEAKAALTPHPVESQASLAPVAAATAAPKSDVAGPAVTPGTSIASTAPAAAAVSAETLKPAGVPERRSQITVRHGDTLEKIAIRYFGSTSGLNALIAANPQLTDINRLTVGQIIYLPRGITAKASHDETATAPPVGSAEDPPAR
jgi:LysM repeat protein